MTNYLLVDGYNIIFAWEHLEKEAKESLEHARIKLLNILSNYKGATNYEIIVVFDAHKVKGGIEKQETYNNITVVFTKEAESADNYIEKTGSYLSKNYKVHVATSDYLEQIIVLSKGCFRMSANELFEDVNNHKKKEHSYTKKIVAKNNMLIDNVDSKTALLLEKMRYGE